MSCGEVVCKVISGIFTLIFTLVSLALMGFSAFATVFIFKTVSYETLEKFYVAVPPIVVFILAALLFVAVILACCAMCQNSTCCLDTYSVFLILLAIGNIAIGLYAVLAFKYPDYSFRAQLDKDLGNYIAKWHSTPGDMDFVQEWARCCGKRSTDDWSMNPLPSSCCRDNQLICTINAKSNIHERGCIDNVEAYIYTIEQVVGIAAIVIGVSQLLATLAAFVLSCLYWRNENYNSW